jgi:glycerol-3-phosphate O-acyltransferase
MATEGGVPQAMYPEGELSVDGRLREPKLGLLDYMLKGFSPDAERDLVFIPVGINYDRVIEDRSLLRKLDVAPRPGSLLRSLRIAGAYLGRQFVFTLLGRRYRYGYACVNFGRPLSMRGWVRERGADFRGLTDAQRREAVGAVGQALMTSIGQTIPVLPVPLVARVLVADPQRVWSELELKAVVLALMERAEALGAHVYVPRSDRDYAISVGLRMLTLRHLALDEAGLIRANPAEMRVLAYYANSIAHLFDTTGDAATETGPEGPVRIDA